MKRVEEPRSFDFGRSRKEKGKATGVVHAGVVRLEKIHQVNT